MFFIDQWKTVNVSDIHPALSLGAPVVLLWEMALFPSILFWRGLSSGCREQYHCCNFKLNPPVFFLEMHVLDRGCLFITNRCSIHETATEEMKE